MNLPLLSVDQQQSLAAAVAVGIGYLLVLYLLARRGGYELAADTPQQQWLYLAWIGLGHLLVAGLPVYLLAEHGLMVPGLVFLVVAGSAIAVELGGGADSPLAIYGMFWLLPLAVILLAAALEYGVRSRLLG